jgi:Putative auto-transporter adhesin, head GIN domain
MQFAHNDHTGSLTLHRVMISVSTALLLATLSVTATFSSAASAQIWNLSITGFGGKTVVGSGKAITEARVTQPFTAVSVTGAADVVIRQTGKTAVEVSGDDNIVPLVTTEVKGQTLVIGFKDKTSMRTKTKLVVRVDVAALTGIGISGSGDVVAEPIKADSLDVSISGSGDIRLSDLNAASLAVSIAGSGDFTASGTVSKQRYNIAGSGDIKSSALKGNDVSVSIAGSGDASVWATGTLSGSIVGSGDIRYLGDATVSKSVLGSGSMKRM